MNAIHTLFLLFLCLSSVLPPLRAQQPARSVDIAWKVLPYRGTADSFGRRVAENFFAVEVHLGNNSGHDLLVSGFYFDRPGSPHRQSLEPNDPYSIVRGTIERDQQVGRRALMMHAIRSMGPLMSLGGAFISGSIITLSKYRAGVGIFSNGIEKGLDNAYPDQTIRQLNRLDSASFNDHLVLRQNEPKSILVFVNRESLQCRRVTCAGLAPYVRDFDPNEAKLRLGTLHLAGQEIEYRQRIRIETNPIADNVH